MISNATKSALNAGVHFMNQPIVKEGIKKAAGSITFAFGVVEIYDIYQIFKGRQISYEQSNEPKWIQIANKVIIICAKISLVLSAATSPPGVILFSAVAGILFSSDRLLRAFGPNTVFAVNPYHPRHIVSIAAVVLALPSVIQTTGQGIQWAYRKIRHYECETKVNQETYTGLSDTKIQLMTLFNTITSRPTLHLGNRFFRNLLRT